MTSTAGTEPGHRWRFYRAGDLDLVRIDTAEDLRRIDELDLELWTALACPVKGLEFDERTLALIDTDRDGRVRAPEVIAAVKWICEVLHDPAVILPAGDSLPISAIKDPALAGAAQHVVTSLGRPAGGAIALDDVASAADIVRQAPFNGDGVVTPESAGDDVGARQIILDILATVGGVADGSGAEGVDAAGLEAFFEALAAFDGWRRQGDQAAGAVFPLGAATEAAAAALDAVRAKIDDYFARCRLAAFDVHALPAMNPTDDAYAALSGRELTTGFEGIAALPIARVGPGRALPLAGDVNPAWAARLAALRDAAITPLLGANRPALTEADWAGVTGRFAAFEAWRAAKAGAVVEPLGATRVSALLAGRARETVSALIARDREAQARSEAVAGLERLLRYRCNLHRLLRNFVSFADFYAPGGSAIFQAGTLYLDSRACELVVRVHDPARHAALAGLSKACLAYCDCTREGEKMQIVAAFTNGTADYLIVGRNGVFYDRRGRDWDATITRIVENPISLREAVWAPYKKFVRMIEEQVAKRAAAADAASHDRLATAAAATASADKGAPPTPKRIDVGTVAALGVALGSIGTFIAALLTKFVDLGPWIPIGLIGLLVLISGPSVLIASLKLRQRNLGPILDASGWAVNGRVKINIPFGASLTHLARLPAGAQRSLRDPYAGRRSPWRLSLFLLALLAAAFAVRWDHDRRGRYFWQKEPPPPALPAIPAPAPEAPAASG